MFKILINTNRQQINIVSFSKDIPDSTKYYWNKNLTAALARSLNVSLFYYRLSRERKSLEKAERIETLGHVQINIKVLGLD